MERAAALQPWVTARGQSGPYRADAGAVCRHHVALYRPRGAGVVSFPAPRNPYGVAPLSGLTANAAARSRPGPELRAAARVPAGPAASRGRLPHPCHRSSRTAKASNIHLYLWVLRPNGAGFDSSGLVRCEKAAGRTRHVRSTTPGDSCVSLLQGHCRRRCRADPADRSALPVGDLARPQLPALRGRPDPRRERELRHPPGRGRQDAVPDGSVSRAARRRTASSSVSAS